MDNEYYDGYNEGMDWQDDLWYSALEGRIAVLDKALELAEDRKGTKEYLMAVGARYELNSLLKEHRGWGYEADKKT